jgi:FAD/FMN-containing dehydrogenase
MSDNGDQATTGSTASGHAATAAGVPARRTFLFSSAAVGAALVVGRVMPAGLATMPTAEARRQRAAASARSAWLFSSGTTPSAADWTALQRALSTHKLYRPGQSGYSFARQLFSPQWDSRTPAGVAYCKTDADAAACISFATKFSLPIRARSGGHSYGGWSSVTGGLIADISAMNTLSYTPSTVTAGAGLSLIDFYGGLAAHGRAVPGGSCPTVGLAGLTLGGGVGVMSRAYGLTCDNLTSLDVVTANGATLTCTPAKNEPLYWASRGGGGGNFGVATSFTFTTRNLSNIVLFFLSWPWSDAARVISAWQSWVPHAPDALWSNLHLSAATGGAPSIGVGGSYIGSVSAAQAQLDKLYSLVGTGPRSHSVVEHTFLSAMLLEAGCANLPVHACDTPPGGHLPRVPFFAKSDIFTKPISSAGITALTKGIENLRGVRGAAGGAGSIAFDALGGAVNRIAPDATAFVHRTALFLAQYYTSWTSPGSSSGVANQRNWIDSYYRSVHPFASGQAYQNYPDPTLANWQQAYYGSNYGMLQSVKATYDPHQVFTFPQAITPPTVGEPCGDAGTTVTTC